MSVSVNEVFHKLKKLNYEIKSILDLVGDECDNVPADPSDIEQQFMRDQLCGIVSKLGDIKWEVDYLNKPVSEQGSIYHNSDGRYELPSGHYFTSGSICEVMRYYDGEQEWVFTSIEHNGKDYYATALGRDVSIEGMTVRIRR